MGLVDVENVFVWFKVSVGFSLYLYIGARRSNRRMFFLPSQLTAEVRTGRTSWQGGVYKPLPLA
jgi:hypothetical protein